MNKNEHGYIGVVLTVLILAVSVAPFLIYRQAKFGTVHNETFTITELPDRAFQKNADGSTNEYANLVYTDKGTFSNVDTSYPWKTRSSDVRSQLKEGQTYTCEVAGWRVGFLSWYKNIIDCEGFKYE